MKRADAAVVEHIQAEVNEAFGEGRHVLAVSGGVDSMVLLDAAVAVRSPAQLVVATFDHGTGAVASSAAYCVMERARELGIACVQGKASTSGRTEAEWRQARWAFLRQVGEQYSGQVVTAHTCDDQVETVFMRVLREAGPRGLAALYASSEVVRPLLRVWRAEIVAYAAARQVRFIADPSNADLRHLRNRIRHELLPAITAIRPGFAKELLCLAHRASDWRAQMDHIAATFTIMSDAAGSAALIPRMQLAGYSTDSLRTLWPALAARVGVIMDWRGTHRLASFTIEGETGQSIQLSGGIDVLLRRDAFVLRHGQPSD